MQEKWQFATLVQLPIGGLFRERLSKRKGKAHKQTGEAEKRRNGMERKKGEDAYHKSSAPDVCSAFQSSDEEVKICQKKKVHI